MGFILFVKNAAIKKLTIRKDDAEWQQAKNVYAINVKKPCLL